jgi:MtrB/PioB family decaheme-associated outer membrane protein
MRITASTVACLMGAGMLSIGATSAAQTPATPVASPPGQSVSIAGEIGARSYTARPDSLSIGKFEEYRDFRAGNKASPLIEQLLLKYAPADSFGFYTLSARKLFDRDQSAWLLAKRPGLYDFQVRSDRIPHMYTSTARSPGDELSHPGFNTLPAIRPDSNAWRNAPYIGPIRNQVDPTKASLVLTPTENVDFKAEYLHIAKNGGIPRSISFSGSSGPQREYVSPIDQTINDARLSQGYTSGDRSSSSVLPFIKNYQVNAGYAYSRFDNAIRSTMVDNPQTGVNTLANGTATARVSLEPSNYAQTATANASMLLPMRTRLLGGVTSSWARQNDTFFPQTSNSALTADPNYGLVSSYSRPSLDGQIRTTTYTMSATTHPVDKLTVTGRYRNFDLSNQTAPFSIKAMVVSDRTVTLADSEEFEPHPFTKTNGNLGATYLVMPGLAVSGGYALEVWERDTAVRNIARTTEKTPRVSVDYTALDWFSLRTSYMSGKRRGNTRYVESGTEIPGFRRFDEADRDRNRFSAAGSVMPISTMTLTLTVESGNDKFPNSQYGVQSDKSLARGVDFDWSPVERFGVSAGWMREDVKDSANYRYRAGVVGNPTFDNTTYRWMNTNKDKDITAYANFNATLIPEKLDILGAWSVIGAHWQMFNRNPTTPTGGTAAQNLAATAQDWPEVKQRLEPVSLSLRYHYSSEWAMTLRFQMEHYSQTDFRTVAPVFTTDGLNASPPLAVGFLPGDLPGTIGQIAGSNTGQYHFLGNNFHPYTANWLVLMVSYHPALIPFERGRSTF